MKKRIYLDNAATTPCDPRVLEAMLPYFTDKFGNASTLYSYGREAKTALEDSREEIARVLNSDSSEVVFTSGGTESNNTALKGVAYALKDKGDHIITSQIEHHAIIEPCKFLEREGFKITYIPVDKFGMVDPSEVRKAITKKTILVSIMHANNEIGTIQPIEEIGKVTRERGVYFHTDAVQTFGHVPIDVVDLGVDLLSASAHKLYGPKGVGFLYIIKGTKIVPFMQGGEQERRKRGSTENVAAIVGLAKAAELAAVGMDEENKKIRTLRDKLMSGIFKRIDQVGLNGHPQSRLSNNINISADYVEGEAMILRLDMDGIACSTGSACSSSSLKPSHVLKAIGLSDEKAHGSLRITLGRFTKEDDIDYVIDTLPKVIKRLRLISPLYSKSLRFEN